MSSRSGQHSFSGMLERWGKRYRDLQKRGFFRYMGRSILWIAGVYLALVVIVFLIGRYLVDFNSLFSSLVGRLSDRLVILLFFISESFTGMIPVDLFLVWTQKFSRPLSYLALLGALSYTGGIISYGIGTWVSRWPNVRAFLERKLYRYIDFVRKWGGAFIIIAALFPFTPFSLVVIALSMMKYPFRAFLLFALSRLIRFILQGVIFFDLFQMDRWMV